MADIIVAPETRDLSELGEKLAHWLAARMPAARDIRIHGLKYPSGAGQSHETILFDAEFREDGKLRNMGCVVRIKPTRFLVYPDDLFAEQYRLMQVLHDGNYVRVARPLWFEEDASILGAPFFVMEKVSGRVPVSIPPYSQVGWVAEATPAQRARLWENGVRELAATQKVPLAEVDFLHGPEHARDGLAQEFDKYVRFVEWASNERSRPLFEAALERLRGSWPDNQPAGLVWGDARLGNMMFDDAFNVVAVMDWEQPSLGGALNDLAWWLVMAEMHHGRTPERAHLEGMGSREDTLALWREITRISTDDIEWYEQFTYLKVGCLGYHMAEMRGSPMSETMLAMLLDGRTLGRG
jgi:aminoglycoside phosphotransferase (APT) family kinase protein